MVPAPTAGPAIRGIEAVHMIGKRAGTSRHSEDLRGQDWVFGELLGVR